MKRSINPTLEVLQTARDYHNKLTIKFFHLADSHCTKRNNIDASIKLLNKEIKNDRKK